ncbi:drug/metabolite transporter (DMT)-like permease [Saccharopolyspora lacisalsi]|uniref:Drug/metabolite transporter (DMT)-like permease n=1 Tax=Halosaccharopolyspora lacisalsi TaxID=1000566 RepID=A0A839DV43_9PSEU|nr:DMT family transporter [Halosaccharopolyspora lacisalsi]MBA8822682.1 drug/metabolite transporter (DMT)-like permease [Halosaccharopolyspora lacisalsi]MBA8822688.1 drug/metabolite transporter (DMT)-like permease [Halosaccharopolyspora lacisalsi]MBA8822707.1 drug/metabolite transporter (DMT)-like permease [Halosaccharopolyspora lacisalsi]
MNNPANYLRIGALALMWGASFLLIKIGLEALTPTQVAFARILFGAVVLLLLCAASGIGLRGHSRKLWGRITVAALFANALPWVLFGLGEQTVDSGLTGVLNATTPLWTLLIGVAFGTEKSLSPRRLSGLLLGFAGVLLILAPWNSGGLFGWGVLACLAAAVSYGIGFVYIGHYVTGSDEGRKLPSLALAAMQLTTATGLGLLTLPVNGMRAVEPELAPLLAVATLGILGTGLAFALHYRIISDEGATTASTVTYLMPVVSIVLGWLVLDERFGWRVVAGMVVVLVGVALSRTRTAAREQRPTSTPRPATRA